MTIAGTEIRSYVTGAVPWHDTPGEERERIFVNGPIASYGVTAGRDVWLPEGDTTKGAHAHTPASIPAYLRWATVAFVALLGVGLFLITYGLHRDAGQLWAGVGLTSLWSGGAALTTGLYVYGRRSGHRLVSQDVALLVMIAAIGMLITAMLATIESVWR